MMLVFAGVFLCQREILSHKKIYLHKTGMMIAYMYLKFLFLSVCSRWHVWEHPTCVVISDHKLRQFGKANSAIFFLVLKTLYSYKSRPGIEMAQVNLEGIKSMHDVHDFQFVKTRQQVKV